MDNHWRPISTAPKNREVETRWMEKGSYRQERLALRSDVKSQAPYGEKESWTSNEHWNSETERHTCFRPTEWRPLPHLRLVKQSVPRKMQLLFKAQDWGYMPAQSNQRTASAAR